MMLKFFKRHVLFLVILFIFCFLWLQGGQYFNPKDNGWLFNGHIPSNFFGSPNQLENVFSPIGALFSAFASAGAIYAVILQGFHFNTQQFENNFFNLLTLHKKNLDAINLDYAYFLKESNNNKDNSIIRKDPFQPCYTFLEHLISCIINNQETEYVFKEYKDEIYYIINDHRAQFDSIGDVDHSKETKFKLCYQILKESVGSSFDQYYHHLYHTIKYIDTNAPFNKKNEYIAILRSQITKYERVFLHYHGLMHHEQKFKNLIEKHCILHDLHKKQNLLLDEGAAGQYSDKAFCHTREYLFLKLRKYLRSGHVRHYLALSIFAVEILCYVVIDYT
jgi:hypothetical protein